MEHTIAYAISSKAFNVLHKEENTAATLWKMSETTIRGTVFHIRRPTLVENKKFYY